MDGGGQAVLLDDGQVFRLEKTFQQQNRPLPAELAQSDGLVQIEQAETVGLAQAFIHAFDAVTVRVGFDDSPHARVGRMTAGNLEIIGKCWAVDDGLDGSWHDGKPAKRECDGALVRACHQHAQKESAPPSPEAHKFHDIKPFNLGMGRPS